MSKRNLLNLILFIFILALVTVIIVEPGKDQAKTPPSLTELKTTDIHRIKLNRPNAAANEQDVEFKKTSSGWQLVKPYPLAANTFRLDSILKLLSAVSFSQNNITHLDLKKFGLESPLATITFNDTTIIFGHNKSLKNHRYVQVGSTLHMIADTFYYQLTAKAESYINHKLLPENSKIKKLHLPDIKLEQTNGIWQVKPKADNFSADAVTQLINKWQLSQAYDIEKIKSQAKSKANITVYLNDNTIIRFKINETKDNFSLINIDSGIRYLLSKDRQNKLLTLTEIEQHD